MSSVPRTVRLETAVAGFPFIVIAGEQAVLRSVLRPDGEELRDLRRVPEGETPASAAAWKFIDRYRRGRDADPPPCDFGWCTDAERAVYAECSRIPFGGRMSYGTLARAAGFPRAASS